MAATTKTGSQTFSRHHHPDLARLACPANPTATTATTTTTMTKTQKPNTADQSYRRERRLGDEAKNQDLVKAARNAKATGKAKPVEPMARSNHRYLTHTKNGDGTYGPDDFNIYNMLLCCTPKTIEGLPMAHKLAVFKYMVAVRQARLAELANVAATSANQLEQSTLHKEITGYVRHVVDCRTRLEELYIDAADLAEQLRRADHWTEYGLCKKQDSDEWHIKYAAKARAEAEAKARDEAAKAQPTQPAQPARQRDLDNFKQRMGNWYVSDDFFNCAKGFDVLDVTAAMNALYTPAAPAVNSTVGV
jgi:hypothetical protein